jgi:murein DD-endopeptidase MepM/ murein hydrolase activator NlpD
LHNVPAIALAGALWVGANSLPPTRAATVDAPAASPPPVAFRFPTANRALLEAGGEERFFVGTVGKPWTSGMFGCVRTEGLQLHEGLDIRCLQRDRRGEPVDPVMATADGVVAYVNLKAGLSNYGIYLILRHQVDGLEVYSLYAHLAQVTPGLRPGQAVRAGDVIATMGQTANTRQGISRDRAHLHFELNLLIHDRFEAWHKKNVGSRNDHGLYNGQNFLGLDPRLLLLSSHRFTTNFNLHRFLSVQQELCRVAVRATNFPWLHRYSVLVRPQAIPGAIAGYELHLDYVGVPVRVLPRTDAELPGRERFTLLEVNEEVQRLYPCRRLVVRNGTRWELGRNGLRLLDLLTHE